MKNGQQDQVLGRDPPASARDTWRVGFPLLVQIQCGARKVQSILMYFTSCGLHACAKEALLRFSTNREMKGFHGTKAERTRITPRHTHTQD